MKRLGNAMFPQPLGNNFRWIWSGSTAGNLADGILLTAGPLLVASITREPFAVAAALFLQRLPWLFFGVLAGALVDRLDRRSLTIQVDLVRAGVLGLLAAAVVFGQLNLTVVYVAMFVLGTAETIADNAATTLLAVAVPKHALGQANARVFGAMVVTNQLAGPPLGAFLFALGSALPFGVNAACFAGASMLVSNVELPQQHEKEQRTTSVRQDVGEGLRWLWSHSAVRTLALMITLFNVTFGAAFSVWVLYAFERLGLGELGFGVLMTASAIGGLIGSAAFRRLELRFSYSLLLRVGLAIETLTHLTLALTTSPFLAGAVMLIFGAHAIVWGTTSTTIRQRAVPEPLLGRVTSVYLLGSTGALSLGTLIGGAIAQRWGITAPFWFAFVGSALILLLLWRSISYVVQAADLEEAPADLTPADPLSPPRPNA